jgi:hypothetical protein
MCSLDKLHEVNAYGEGSVRPSVSMVHIETTEQIFVKFSIMNIHRKLLANLILTLSIVDGCFLGCSTV